MTPITIERMSTVTFRFPESVPVIGGRMARGTDVVARWYGEDGGAEPVSLEMVRRLLDEGGVFVDVGANIGAFTVAAALVAGPDGIIHSFEPATTTRQLLHETLELNGLSSRVTVHPVAASSTSGRRRFYTHEVDLLSSLGQGPLHAGTNFTEVEVELCTLDERIAGPVDLMKIDVEGFEPEVLRGARDLIERNPAMGIICEVGPLTLRSAGHDVQGLVDEISRPDRTLWVIDDRARPGPHGRISRAEVALDWITSDAPTTWYGNLLSVAIGAEARFADLIDR